MIGIPDPGIWLAYGLAVVSALICVVYGLLNWNKGAEEDPPQEIAKWVAEEKTEVEDAV